MVKDHLYNERGNLLPPRGLLFYVSLHRQDGTYHGLCYTSRGALAGTRNSSMGYDRTMPYEMLENDLKFNVLKAVVNRIFFGSVTCTKCCCCCCCFFVVVFFFFFNCWWVSVCWCFCFLLLLFYLFIYFYYLKTFLLLLLLLLVCLVKHLF